MDITLKPAGYVSNNVLERQDDNWSQVTSVIELASGIPSESLKGLHEFSHVEIIFYMDRLEGDGFSGFSRIPRNNPDFPEVGIFSQRASRRPNKIGATIVRLVRVEDNRIIVKGLDAIDGTPVVDIKPVMKEFLPSAEETFQPQWASELMKNYW